MLLSWQQQGFRLILTLLLKQSSPALQRKISAYSFILKKIINCSPCKHRLAMINLFAKLDGGFSNDLKEIGENPWQGQEALTQVRKVGERSVVFYGMKEQQCLYLF